MGLSVAFRAGLECAVLLVSQNEMLSGVGEVGGATGRPLPPGLEEVGAWGDASVVRGVPPQAGESPKLSPSRVLSRFFSPPRIHGTGTDTRIATRQIRKPGYVRVEMFAMVFRLLYHSQTEHYPSRLPGDAEWTTCGTSNLRRDLRRVSLGSCNGGDARTSARYRRRNTTGGRWRCTTLTRFCGPRNLRRQRYRLGSQPPFGAREVAAWSFNLDTSYRSPTTRPLTWPFSQRNIKRTR